MNVKGKIVRVFKRKRPLTLDEITASLDSKLNYFHNARSVKLDKIEVIKGQIAVIEKKVKGIGSKFDTIMKKIKDF